jgi:hypothetical protein
MDEEEKKTPFLVAIGIFIGITAIAFLAGPVSDAVAPTLDTNQIKITVDSNTKVESASEAKANAAQSVETHDLGESATTETGVTYTLDAITYTQERNPENVLNPDILDGVILVTYTVQNDSTDVILVWDAAVTNEDGTQAPTYYLDSNRKPGEMKPGETASFTQTYSAKKGSHNIQLGTWREKVDFHSK